MKVKDFLDVLTSDKIIKINGKIVTTHFDVASSIDKKVMEFYGDKDIIAIKVHHNCIELEVA
jgi:hypothetical protein